MRRRLGVLAAFAAVAIALTPATPAVAHDQLIESSPRAGERLTSAPSEVRMQFSAALMDIGAVVIVIDAADTDWVAAAAPVIDGSVVTMPLLPDMPEAGYQVRWQVVSSDGHPISGYIPFTIGDAAPLEVATAGELPGQIAAENQSITEQSAVWRALLIGAAGAVAALAVLVLVTVICRRRDRRVDDDASAAAGVQAEDSKGTHPS